MCAGDDSHAARNGDGLSEAADPARQGCGIAGTSGAPRAAVAGALRHPCPDAGALTRLQPASSLQAQRNVYNKGSNSFVAGIW